jgi:hypothetical protein
VAAQTILDRRNIRGSQQDDWTGDSEDGGVPSPADARQ